MRTDLFWALGLLVAVVITGLLVNRLAPERRQSLRQVAILFVLYAVALGLRHGLGVVGATTWAKRLLLAAQLLQAFTVVNIASTIAFAVALPRVGVNLPMIARDLVIGVGYVVTTLGVLSGHGLDPSGILATSAVVSAVLVISLQSTLGNILGGVALQLDGSVHEGDWIQLENGRQGRVRAIRWRHTVIETRDWSTIIVPNAQLLANSITILGKRGGREVPQRMWVWFNVDYRFPPAKVIQVVTDALLGSPIEGVAAEPRPSVVCMDFARTNNESVASYAARYWLTDLAADDPTNSRVRARIFAALGRADIPLAVPAQTTFVEMRDAERVARRERRRLAARLAAVRAVQLFRSLTEDELVTLAEGVSPAQYVAGEVMTRQGAIANWLYIMTSGEAEVHTTYDPDGDGPAPAETRLVATLRAPDFFGEFGLMTGAPREADVIATTDVECYRLDKETFERVLLHRPAIMNELSERLAARRVELQAVRENLDAAAQLSRRSVERERILGGIKSFFGL